MSVAAEAQKMEFQAEVKQLLQLMIHSLYSNKDIFLRELISNASDAADKLRFEAIQDETLTKDDPELNIHVSFDKDARTITVRDNGIGMTRQEVIENLGTIAKSGTKQFLQNLTGDQAKDANLIGQFGVGFYSSFVVADKVTVQTRKAGAPAEEGVIWESSGEGDFTIADAELPARGTEVTLHLREGEDEYLDGFRLRQIIRTYSDHISMPILMPSADEDDQTEETVNKASALWMRPKQDVSEEEYHEFYKHVAHDFDDPLAYMHNRVEGNNNYTSLLYIPKRAPFDLWERDPVHGIKLYVRRVFIMDDTEHLMPRYLRFVRGVIDSDDLPLNVSREILQSNRQLDRIRSASVKRVLDKLESIAKDEPEAYQQFWEQFGKVMKEGPGEDFANRERIAKLLRFASTHNGTAEQVVSLDDYLGRMKESQEKIYFLTAETFNGAIHSPHLEIFRKKGVEVLLLTDPVDEWLVSHLNEYEGKQLQSVAKGDLDLGDLEDEAEKKDREQTESEFKGFLDKVKEALGDRVKEVRLSHRLTDTPSCLVVEAYEMNMGMQRMLKAAGHAVPQSKPVFELNPEHPLVAQLKEGGQKGAFDEWVTLFYEQALLAEGGQLDDPHAFVKRLNALLKETGA